MQKLYFRVLDRLYNAFLRGKIGIFRLFLTLWTIEKIRGARDSQEILLSHFSEITGAMPSVTEENLGNSTDSTENGTGESHNGTNAGKQIPLLTKTRLTPLPRHEGIWAHQTFSCLPHGADKPLYKHCLEGKGRFYGISRHHQAALRMLNPQS